MHVGNTGIYISLQILLNEINAVLQMSFEVAPLSQGKGIVVEVSENFH